MCMSVNLALNILLHAHASTHIWINVHRLQLWLNGIFNLVYTDTDSIDRQTQQKNIERKKNKTQIGLQSRINRYFKINLLETCACIFICSDWYCLGNIIHTLFIAGQEINMRAYFSDKTHSNSMYSTWYMVWEWWIFYRIRDRGAEWSVWVSICTVFICLFLHTCIEIK